MRSRRPLPPFVFSLLVASFLSVAKAQPAPELVLHVAPGGDDHWSGKLARPDGSSDGPLASLRGARDRVRALRNGDAKRFGSVVVWIAGRAFRAGALSTGKIDLKGLIMRVRGGE